MFARHLLNDLNKSWMIKRSSVVALDIENGFKSLRFYTMISHVISPTNNSHLAVEDVYRATR